MIIIVSGLPRSGTSMMMSVLETAGLDTLTDEIRKADMDNPKGYFEFERVKKLPEKDYGWMEDANKDNKVVKIISYLLKYLPDNNYQYKILFMERDLKEILMSQKKMLIRRDEENTTSDNEMQIHFEKHLEKIKRWLAMNENFDVLYVSYNNILSKPEDYIDKLRTFLELDLEYPKIANVVDKRLYRQRNEESKN